MNEEIRIRHDGELLITEKWTPKMSMVPTYKDGFGWYKREVFLGLYEWVVIKEELLPFDEVEIII